jgi:starch synthase
VTSAFPCAVSCCRPDIVHTHDWATAPVAFGDLGGATKAVFTIHNLNYGADLIGRAMGAAAACTTVSPTYAAEVGPSFWLLCLCHNWL